jgi:glycosyltransferase involved in cell wall biosynthesis
MEKFGIGVESGRCGLPTFMPQSAFKKYDLMLIDTPAQLEAARKAFPKIRSELFIKPAADNIFKPVEIEKEYDVIFSSNEHKRGIKGHDFILPALPKNIKMIQVGISSPKLQSRYPNIEFTGWVPRKKIPSLYGKAKVAVVCCTNVDSCPRVIPEAIACNCPLLVLDTVNIWRDKYITPQTGKIASRNDFVSNIQQMISTYRDYDAYNYYQENLSLSVAAKHIKTLIGG